MSELSWNTRRSYSEHAAAIEALAQMLCIGWRPIRRRNPNSSLRGLLDLELRSGLIINDSSVCSAGHRHWVQPAARLRLNPRTKLPTPPPYCWDPVVEFRDKDARRRFSDEAIAALLQAYPDALDPDLATIPEPDS